VEGGEGLVVCVLSLELHGRDGVWIEGGICLWVKGVGMGWGGVEKIVKCQPFYVT